ncbi:flagellar biosynthetic protein FlhB [Roseivivax lentus]|uniref:Flagellar biosynthetic protein FlhB n=1 Tax=Roseivivax lentus TaxID=633194 RepID=A0A1N7JLN0_9RHOB|nr:flagellar type III secretion system protein FlhB [Roseivivax lentus]SIS50166.1 flagellar biosynthetic protein FlhB [Roseivivax lentus]
MAEEAESGEKPHEPSARRLEQARKKGEIARSPDLLTAAVYAGVLLTALVAGADLARISAERFLPFIEQPDRLISLFFGDAATAPTGGLLQRSLVPGLPFILVPATLVFAALVAQRGLVFTPSKLAPKLNRISLIANAKNKYGRRGFFEFAKSATKLTIYSACLGLVVWSEHVAILESLQSSPGEIARRLGTLMVRFLSYVLVISLAIGIVDALWQDAEHRRKNRMSHKDLRDEFKEMEGDPAMKQERRQRAHDIAMNQMMADVPKADVVVVNPTHYAVALKWSRQPGTAPVCVAKGVDEVAHRIRQVAEEAGVPIKSDPPTARALYATVDIGAQIEPDLYKAVAAAIRFSEEMRAKARARG